MVRDLFPLLRLLDDPDAVRLAAASTEDNGAARTESHGFLIGPENDSLERVLRRALQVVARGQALPGPIVVTGPPGSGKSSLATAFAEAFVALRPKSRPVMTTGADFARAFADAVDAAATTEFRQRQRKAGLIVIDGLGGLARKTAAQLELRTHLDRLIDRGTIVFCTATTPPTRDPALLPDLASRLAGGVCVSIAEPEDGTRREIIGHWMRTIIAGSTRSAAYPALVDDLAKALHSRRPRPTALAIRGAVVETLRLAENLGRAPTSVELKTALDQTASPAIDVKRVATAVGRWLGVPLQELKGPSRRQSIVRARGLAMTLARQRLGASLSQLGRFFGGRDHTTVMNACQRTERELQTDPSLKAALAAVSEQLAEFRPATKPTPRVGSKQNPATSATRAKRLSRTGKTVEKPSTARRAE